MPGPLYPIQPNFARGEISPRLFSRADIDHWRMALALCVNWMILKQGGLRRRSGSEWIGRAKFPDKETRLHPFVFSTKQAYVLEIGDLYIRFYANGGLVNVNSATGITFNTTTNVVNWTAHGLSNGQPVVFSTSGSLPTPLVAGVTYYVVNKNTNDFQVAATVGGAAIDLGGTVSGTHGIIAPTEVVTPYTEDDVWTLQFSQSADFIYIAHGLYQPRTLTRTSASVFSIATYAPENGPYLGENTTSTTMTPSATSGSITITASAVTGINGGSGFVASDVGRPISLQYSSKWYWCKITAVGSTTSITATVYGLVEADGTVVTALPGTGATGGWKIGAWSETTGWPACVTFYQQRLVWGRSDAQPQTVWMTKAGVLTSFATTVPLQEDDAITLTILAGEVNAIQWLAESADLLIGTTGAMRTIGPADSGKVFSALNVVERRQSTFGSMAIQPVQVGPVAIYPSYYGKSLRECLFSFQQNSYITPELTILSEHMMRSGVRQISYAQEPDSIIWMSMGNGELVGITYERDQQIVAMARHRLGGEVLNSGIVDPDDPDDPDTHYAVVESVACIPGADRTEVWLSVIRTIDGEVTRYIERLTKPFEAMEKKDAVFVDSSYTYSGAATGTVTGVNWLIGQEISILADGAVMPNQTVSDSGSFTLPNSKEASTITFGIPYSARGKTLPIAAGIGDGTGLGRQKNVVAANLDYMETGYLEVGSPNARELSVAIGLRGREDAMDDSPPLKDGFYTVRFDRGWKDAGQIVFETDKPLPATIRSITPVFDA